MSKIIICGPAASGKDTLRNEMARKGFGREVSYTTRPKREGEIEGVDYFFVSDEEFNEMIQQDKFTQWNEFNGWKYGTSKEAFEEHDLFIMTPEGIRQIREKGYRHRCLIIFLDVPENIRRERLMERGDDNDSFERRMKADEEQFKDFHDWDIRIPGMDNKGFDINPDELA